MENLSEKTAVILDEIRGHAGENYIPIIREKTLQSLTQACKNASNILEIGTATGYSASCMLLYCDAFVTTIEKDPVRATQAAQNFNKLNLSHRVRLITGDAAQELKALTVQGERFDFIFLDGPKGQYEHYYDDLKTLLRRGGILFADNVFLHGMVKSDGTIPHKHRSMVVNLRKFLKRLQSDSDFQTQIFDIEDGFTISKKLK